jgi:predicted RNase H-like nuclease
MKLFNPPVAKMFWQGAPRLLAAGVSVLPCRPSADGRTALEAYPALVARAYNGGASYKGDEPRKNTPERRAARQTIVEGLRRNGVARYGVSLALPAALADELVADHTADRLDALLCAVQAAWAYRQPDASFGILPDVDANEGWIVDPSQLRDQVTG